MTTPNRRTVEFDPETEPVLPVIVRAVAAVQNTEPTELPPLAEAVDVELLQHAVDANSSGTIQRGHIKFEWEGVTVSLDVDGEVTITWE